MSDQQDSLLERAVESLLSITDEYDVQWSDNERRTLARRFRIVVGMFGEAKAKRRVRNEWTP